MPQQQPITLYGVNSPNVLKVAIMLEELELPYTLRHVALFNGEQFTPEFRALSPLGKVPVILDSRLERPLAESGAILLWLAEKSGKLLPAEGDERYDVLQWLMIQMSAIGPMLGQFTHFKLLPVGSEPYAYGRYEALAEKLYGELDKRLAGREWLAGNAYSIADVATFPWGDYIDRHGFNGADYPSLFRWRKAVAGRDAVKRAQGRITTEFAGPTVDTMKAATPEDIDRFFNRTDKVPQQDFTAVTRLS